MSPSRPSLRSSAAPPRWQLLVALCCLLLLACAPGDEGVEPAAEEELVQRTAPQEDPSVEEPETLGVEQVAVELPGLPVGGAGPQLSRAAPSACVQVNWTAGTLLDGVRVLVREVAVQPPFAEWSGPCAPPCEGGVLTAQSSVCEVGVTVADPASPPTVGQLGVTDAALVCDSQSLCEQTLALIRERGPATVELELVDDTGTGTGTDTGTGAEADTDTGTPGELEDGEEGEHGAAPDEGSG